MAAFFVTVSVVALAFGSASGAATGVTLALTPAVADWGSSVAFTGVVTPAQAADVKILRKLDGGERLVIEGMSNADGTYEFSVVRWRPGVFIAESDGARSAEAPLRIRPRLRAHFFGLPVLGAPLFVRGRLRPTTAGSVWLTVAGQARKLDKAVDGRFRAKVPTVRAGRLDVTVAVRPRSGYVRVKRVLSTAVRTPILSVGSRGKAVSFLERRLHALRYALRKVDPRYRRDTKDAVLAFQKVEGLDRDGVVGPQTWTALRTARVPVAGVPSGRHIEVDKERQVLFEVRRGSVRRIVQVSTGATGNTPVGRWRIYRKTPGHNSLGMYYSMYFLRGFAIHGYASVPAYPASHGCVREPLWFAPRIYSRWDIGAKVWIMPTTLRTSVRWLEPARVARATHAKPTGGCGG
jgi:hypothetical protein